MKKVKKLAAVLVAAMMVLSMAGCGAAQTEKEELDAPQAEADAFDAAKEIGVISREDGSGTRGAFIELFGIEQKNEAGEKFRLLWMSLLNVSLILTLWSRWWMVGFWWTNLMYFWKGFLLRQERFSCAGIGKCVPSRRLPKSMVSVKAKSKCHFSEQEGN